MSNKQTINAIEALDTAITLYDEANTDPCLCGTPDGELDCPRCGRLERARRLLDQTVRRALAPENQ